MISKKTKALAAGILSAVMSATAIVPAMASATDVGNEFANSSNDSYKDMFVSLYDDVMVNGQDNGYLSKKNNGGDSFGIPYHSVETLCVEAPDYGHETTSEAMSYIVWMAAMHDVLAQKGIIDGSTGDVKKAWKTMEAMIPGWSEASGVAKTAGYESLWQQSRLKADTANEEDTPDMYPAKQANVEAINPMFNTFKSAYGSDNGYYLMNWLADVDDWYGFGGSRDGGSYNKDNTKFVFINTFQRGEQESCFETVPQPCLEDLKYGMSGNGIKAIFNGVGSVPEQYAFTNAPDAEDRAIQAIYFANANGVNCGEVSGLAGKMGDQCRNDMFDKYYHEIGCQNIKASGEAGTKSQHFLMAWYTAWGGDMSSQHTWAWQIGCSHSHQFYQNPLAAYALVYDDAISGGMKASGAKDDYEKSFKRQLEMYLWLQSVDGPFAGGCTNSYRGRYEKYPAGYPTFYDMVYVPHPVYADPGSNHWIGNQVWSMQRLAELYYYVKKNPSLTANISVGGLSVEEALKALIERWVDWFEKNTKFDYVADDGTEMAYAIPSTLDWGENDTDYNVCPDTWTGTYNPNGNQKLTCTIKGYGMGDVGCVSSLCNTLMYYAAAEGVPASAGMKEDTSSVASKGLYLANRLLSAQYDLGRDDIGIAFEDHNGSLKRMFTEKVYIPSDYSGKMPDGSPLVSGTSTFSSIRGSYADDPMYQQCKKVYDETGETEKYTYKLHRFWHHGDAIMAYGTMALLYPEVTPIHGTEPSGETKWGDANCDGTVDISDAVLIMQNQANPEKYVISKQGLINADCVDNPKGVTATDALAIQMIEAKTFTQDKLPVTSDYIQSLQG